ncbi:MAG: hydroxymethylglutaryl-CoA lyase [Deltaproteobacteria bacterium]|nr:hydroxymethylglutaryl-CoA lyase [Deltaproteobacteria bacterium]
MFEKLPRRVSVYEVGLRDGLQAEPRFVPTEDKLRLANALVATGLQRIEASSFVHAKWIPALADADQLVPRLPKGPTWSALTPNLRGLERALAAGITEVAVFLAASETYSLKNTNKSIAESLKSSEQVAVEAKKHGLKIRAYLSSVWGSPYEPGPDIELVVRITQQLLDMGCYEVSLGDTVGIGNPLQTQRILEALFYKNVPKDKLAVHLHDTRGTALANALVALELGITTFDASVGGLGGSPYAPGATGNLATEDLVNMLHGMGIETGVDLAKLVQAAAIAQDLVGHPLTSKYFKAAIGSGAH